jgi:hypothetical protein
MRIFTALTLALCFCAASFAKIISLGPKTDYEYQEQLEPKSIWELVDNFCTCGHLTIFPADKIPRDKKLVLGRQRDGKSEYLFIIENNFDAQNSFVCGLDAITYYFLDINLIE